MSNKQQAIRDCTKAIELVPFYAKALIRRAKAFEQLGEHDKALADVQTVVELQAPHQTPALLQEALAAKDRLSRCVMRDRVVRISEPVPDTLMTSAQTVRLYLRDAIAKTIVAGVPFPLSLALVNEFGLWNRSLLAEGASVELDLSIVALNTSGSDNFSPPYSLLPSSVPISTSGRVKGMFVLHFHEDTRSDNVSATFVLLRVKARKGALDSGQVVVPVLSLPVRICISTETILDSSPTETCNEVEIISSQATALGAHCIRELYVSTIEALIFCFESPGYLGIAGKVWDSAFVLVSFLSNNVSLINNHQVMELGSGTGIAGIAVAMLPCREVILTDLEAVLPLIQANIDLNRLAHVQLKSKRIEAVAHPWGGDMSDQLPPCADVLIMSDVVYDPSLYAPLVESLCRLIGPQTYCLMAYRHRHPEDRSFFELLTRAGLRFSDVQFELPETLHQSCKDVRLLQLEIALTSSNT